MRLRNAFQLWKTPTIRVAMVAVALIAAGLGLFVNERWRWGYPRRVPVDRETALSWMATVCRSDFRMYNGIDVAVLMDLIARDKLLIGKSQKEVVGLLGPALNWSPSSLPPDSFVVYFQVGTIPDHWHAEPAMIYCRFDQAGKCVEVIPLASG